MKNELQDILIAFILLQFAVLYATNDYAHDVLAEEYSLSEKWYYCLEAFLYFFWSIVSVLFNQDKRYKLTWKIMACFLGIRFIWEISAVTNGVTVNEKEAMSILFLINFLTITCITYLQQLKRILNWIWQALS